MKPPKVSVIMPVYNAEKYIEETIDSILGQTFKDYEFLIIDDGSTDKSLQILNSCTDPRIKVFKNFKNIGYVQTLNKLIELSKGEYIARQDNDDISLPKRLEIQVDFLNKNPNVGICGTDAFYFGARKEKITKFHRNEDIKAQMIFGNQIIHPSVLMRSCLFKGENGLRYDNELCPAEDYALWFEISKNYEIANLKTPLLRYRWHENNVSQLKENDQIDHANHIRHMILENTLSIKLTEEEKHIHNFISRPKNLELHDLDLLETWLTNIQKVNKECCYYDERALRKAVFDNWSYVCRNNNRIPSLKLLFRYYSSRLFKMDSLLTKSAMKTSIKNFYKIIDKTN